MSKIYATMQNPTIAGVIEGQYSFVKRKDALDLIDSIKQRFKVSKHSPDKKSAVILWIKGCRLSSAERKRGFVGNYVLIEVTKGKNTKFFLKIRKLDSELKYHPQRKYQRQQHPNWGHPILRSAKRKKTYATKEEAQQELTLLQEEYPKTAIPARDKLYVMIYSKDKRTTEGSRVKKYTLEIKKAEEGGYFIGYYENRRKKLPPTRITETDEPPRGYFTDMVQKRRQKKKPAPKTE